MSMLDMLSSCWQLHQKQRDLCNCQQDESISSILIVGGVELTLVSQRCVGCYRVHKDPKQGKRGEETPTELPIDADGDVEHELDVLDELLEAVDPGNTNSFNHGKEEYDESPTKEINKTKDGLSSRGDVKEPDAKPEKADDPSDKSLVPTRVDVTDDGNDSAGEASS